jgi:hypothetical protein
MEMIEHAPVNAAAEFDAAMQSITDRRGAVYAHPSINFDRIAKIKAALADCPDPLIRHGMEMIAVKLARLVETPYHMDSIIDIGGYARTLAMLIDAGQYKAAGE